MELERWLIRVGLLHLCDQAFEERRVELQVPLTYRENLLRDADGVDLELSVQRSLHELREDHIEEDHAQNLRASTCKHV